MGCGDSAAGPDHAVTVGPVNTPSRSNRCCSPAVQPDTTSSICAEAAPVGAVPTLPLSCCRLVASWPSVTVPPPSGDPPLSYQATVAFTCREVVTALTAAHTHSWVPGVTGTHFSSTRLTLRLPAPVA